MRAIHRSQKPTAGNEDFLTPLIARPNVPTPPQVILKPANSTPLTALALAVLAARAGVPNGVLNVLTGDSKEISAPIAARVPLEPPFLELLPLLVTAVNPFNRYQPRGRACGQLGPLRGPAPAKVALVQTRPFGDAHKREAPGSHSVLAAA